MTQLSKALTAETPEQRFKALVDEVYAGLNRPDSCPSLDVALIEQFYTNERTLLMGAEKGNIDVQLLPTHMNNRQAHTDPMTAAPTPSPPVKQEAQPEAAKSPLAGPLPPQAAKPGRSVADVISALDDNGGLPPEMFARWLKLGKGRYPTSKQARTAALTALSDAERYMLMSGGIA